MPGTSDKTERFTLRIPNALMARLRERAAGGSVARVIIDRLEASVSQGPCEVAPVSRETELAE
jgi:hypothetical protein